MALLRAFTLLLLCVAASRGCEEHYSVRAIGTWLLDAHKDGLMTLDPDTCIYSVQVSRLVVGKTYSWKVRVGGDGEYLDYGCSGEGSPSCSFTAGKSGVVTFEFTMSKLLVAKQVSFQKRSHAGTRGSPTSDSSTTGPLLYPSSTNFSTTGSSTSGSTSGSTQQVWRLVQEIAGDSIQFNLAGYTASLLDLLPNAVDVNSQIVSKKRVASFVVSTDITFSVPSSGNATALGQQLQAQVMSAANATQHSLDLTVLQTAVVDVTPAPPATPSPTPSPSPSPSPVAPGTSPDQSARLGVGIGIGLGLPIVLAGMVATLFFYRRSRHPEFYSSEGVALEPYAVHSTG